MMATPMITLALTLPSSHMTWDSWDGGWWVAMMAGMILFWGLVILGAVLLVRELVARRDASGREPDALAILDRRLAEGEVSPEEYRERRAVLRGGE